ncbi:MAG TPA: hypothetical protein VFF91_08395 [Pseudoxanthomonas sp.]|nr:hypothetical protein [Pseudoxanthomonas sp.]
MNTTRIHALALPLLLACAIPMTACSRDQAPASTPAADAADEGFIARTTRKALEEARREMASGNIAVGGEGSGSMNINGVAVAGSDSRSGHLPKAEISPAGDLLIGGKPVPVTEDQRRLLLEHRANIMAIAEAGIAIGMEGAKLGTRAATEALVSVFSGKADEFEKRMEAEGAKIEAEARKLCDRLPALLSSQQALAATLPAFKPYATMEASDIEDCRDETRAAAQAVADAATGQAGADSDANADADAGSMDAAAEADAAAARR